MKCPLCGSSLSATQLEGVDIAVCPTGHGMFVTTDQLHTLVAVRETIHSRQEEDAALGASGDASGKQLEHRGPACACPECETVMNKATYAYDSGVTIDVCPTHGIWLDSGELGRIESWVEGSERQHAQDVLEWAPKLAAIASEEKQQMIASQESVHTRMFQRMMHPLTLHLP